MLSHHLQHNTWLPLPGQSDGEIEQIRLGLAGLEQFNLRPCPVAFLQASNLLVLYFFNKGDFARGCEIFAKANQMALDHNLDVQVLEPPPLEEATHFGFKVAPTTWEAETQAALSQLVYLDVAFNIILKLPSLIDPRLYACFKTLIVRSAWKNWLDDLSTYILVFRPSPTHAPKSIFCVQKARSCSRKHSGSQRNGIDRALVRSIPAHTMWTN